MIDKRRYRSDVSDWSSSNPITPVVQAPPHEISIERPTGPLSRSNRSVSTPEIQVGSEGAPHASHADSVSNDEHGSRSDISD